MGCLPPGGIFLLYVGLKESWKKARTVVYPKSVSSCIIIRGPSSRTQLSGVTEVPEPPLLVNTLCHYHQKVKFYVALFTSASYLHC